MTTNLNENNGSTAQRIAVGMSRLGLALRQQNWQQAGGRGITPTQGQVLAHLAGQSEPQRLGHLVDALALTAATVSECVQVLAEKGLVKKVRDPQDGRALRLTLTASGRREAQRAASWPDFLAGAVEVLNPAEQSTVLRGLSKMIHELENRGQIPAQRMCLSCSHFKAHASKDKREPHRCAYLGRSLGDHGLQLDCQAHQVAEAAQAGDNWASFSKN